LIFLIISGEDTITFITEHYNYTIQGCLTDRVRAACGPPTSFVLSARVFSIR
jgi:hypothetical protein